jgi:hypothetical protein
MSVETRSRYSIGALSALFLVGVAALRLHEAEPGLLYPDGYQYLLMAKGIAAHGRPLLMLGPHGDTLLPNGDAAAKPLYPAIVALFHGFGLTWLGAARMVTALAATCTALLTGMLARRLSGSWLAAFAAATACIASRELSFWSGFAGPDALGEALALASALALLCRRPRTGGALAALAILARPELALVALAAAGVGLWRSDLRRPTRDAALAGVLTLAVVLAVLRPPIEPPPAAAVLLGALLATLAAAAFAALTREGPPIVRILLGGVVAAIVLVAPLRAGGEGLRLWVQHDWPLLLAGLVGAAVAARSFRLRPALIAVLLAGALLLLVYSVKNPGSDRYLALLTPLVALLASFATSGAARPANRVFAFGVVGLIALTLALPRLPAHSSDQFPTVAAQLQALHLPSLPFVTAAPDAYGVLVPDRSFVVARPGARGLIIADGAERTYAASLRPKGRTLATLDPGGGFVRPDGALDQRPVRIILGTVTRRSP